MSNKQIKVIVLTSLSIMTLSSCCKQQVYNTSLSSVPLHRLAILEKPVCRKETYKDLVDCLLSYKDKLEQSNKDKEEILKVINK